MPLMGRWADGFPMAPGNVSDFTAEEDGWAVGLIVGVEIDGPRPENFPFHQRHVVGVDNGAAEVVDEVFQAEDAALESHKVLGFKARKFLFSGVRGR